MVELADGLRDEGMGRTDDNQASDCRTVSILEMGDTGRSRGGVTRDR